MEYKNCSSLGTCVARDGIIGLTDVSANTHLQITQLRPSKALFLKFMCVVLEHVPLERWFQHMIGGLKTVHLAWVNQNRCDWLYMALRL